MVSVHRHLHIPHSNLQMSHGKQFTLYTNVFGPNGWYVGPVAHSFQEIADTCLLASITRKVAIVLEELGLTYESIYLTFEKGEHKAPDYLRITPNGRIPALIDHRNNDFVVWSARVSRRPLASSHLERMTQGIPCDHSILGGQV